MAEGAEGLGAGAGAEAEALGMGAGADALGVTGADAVGVMAGAVALGNAGAEVLGGAAVEAEVAAAVATGCRALPKSCSGLEQALMTQSAVTTEDKRPDNIEISLANLG
jgi:hypothetical protein